MGGRGCNDKWDDKWVGVYQFYAWPQRYGHGGGGGGKDPNLFCSLTPSETGYSTGWHTHLDEDVLRVLDGHGADFEHREPRLECS